MPRSAIIDPVTFTANRAGSPRTRLRTNSDRVLPVRSRWRFDGWPPGFNPVPVNIRSKLTAQIKPSYLCIKKFVTPQKKLLFPLCQHPSAISCDQLRALTEKIPFQREHWTPEWLNTLGLAEQCEGVSFMVAPPLHHVINAPVGLWFQHIALELIFNAVPRAPVCHPKRNLFGIAVHDRSGMQLKFVL